MDVVIINELQIWNSIAIGKCIVAWLQSDEAEQVAHLDALTHQLSRHHCPYKGLLEARSYQQNADSLTVNDNFVC